MYSRWFRGRSIPAATELQTRGRLRCVKPKSTWPMHACLCSPPCSLLASLQGAEKSHTLGKQIPVCVHEHKEANLFGVYLTEVTVQARLRSGSIDCQLLQWDSFIWWRTDEDIDFFFSYYFSNIYIFCRCEQKVQTVVVLLRSFAKVLVLCVYVVSYLPFWLLFIFL